VEWGAEKPEKPREAGQVKIVVHPDGVGFRAANDEMGASRKTWKI